MSTTPTTNTVEMIYRRYGENWKHKTFRNDAAFQRWMNQHEDDIAEIRWPD